MSSVLELSAKNFVLQNLSFDTPQLKEALGKPTILFIKAVWCGYCRRYKNTFESLYLTLPKVNLATIEETTDKNLLIQWKNLAYPAFEVQGYPTIVIYNREGMPIQVVDDRSPEGLKKKLLELDLI